MIATGTRRGDWVARWGGDEFIVGLHRNFQLRMVIDRIVKAVSGSSLDIAPGSTAKLSVSVGVATYRFGSGAAGIVADADKAMYAAKSEAHTDGRSRVCYFDELHDPEPTQRLAS